jgi:hypothetical protein
VEDKRMTNPQELHEDVRAILNEADHMYTLMIEAGESPNIDNVGYTSTVALDVFRRLLGRPDLQVAELEQLLRAAAQQVRAQIGPQPYVRVPKPVLAPEPSQDWSALMARIVVAGANDEQAQRRSHVG